MGEKQLEYDRIFRSPRRTELYRKRCRIVEVGSTKHAVLLEFEDGVRIIASRRATMKIR